MNQVIPSTSIQKWTSIIGLVLVLFSACLLELCFAWAIFKITDTKTSIEVKRSSSFSLEKAGIYTLWESSDNGDDQVTNASQFQIQRVNNGEIVSSIPLFGSAVWRADGERYVAVCNYELSARGLYSLTAPDDRESHKFLLARKVSISLVLSIFASFFAGGLLFVIAWYMLHKRNPKHHAI